MTRPGSVSNTRTPSIVPGAQMKSTRVARPLIDSSRAVLTRWRRRSAGTSTSSITAAMTTAARAGSGSDSKRPVRKGRVTIVSNATT
jgi:hypothetical protein